MSLMFKAAGAAACITLFFATSILTRDRADTGWKSMRSQSAHTTERMRASSSTELTRELEKGCAEQAPCSATAPSLNQIPVIASTAATSQPRRQGRDVQVTGSVLTPPAAKDNAVVSSARRTAATKSNIANSAKATACSGSACSAPRISASAQGNSEPAALAEPDAAPKSEPEPVQFRLADRG
jgi:hypothetical protein